MKEEYEKALQKIQELKKRITVREWNKLAMQESLLSSESLKYIIKKNFKVLCDETRK